MHRPLFVRILALIFAIIWVDLLTAQENDPEKPAKKTVLQPKATWEKAIDLPGDLVFLPVKLLLEISRETLEFIDNSKIIPETIDLITSDDGVRGVRPTYNSRTGAGAYYFHRNLLQEGTRLNLTATSSFDAENQSFEFKQHKFSLAKGLCAAGFFYRYTKLDEESYYGSGPTSTRGDRASYGIRQKLLTFEFDVTPDAGLSLNLTGSYEKTKIRPTHDDEYPSIFEVYDESSLPGIAEVADLLIWQTELHFIRDDRAGNPTRSTDLLIYGGIFNDVGADRFDFWRSGFDFNKVFHLFYNRTLALRIAAEFTRPFTGKTIPFYYLSEIGRYETIRGFKRGRFHDRDRLLASIEYRYPIWNMCDAYLFADAGKVAYNLATPPPGDNLIAGYGAGIRVYNSGGLVLKTELGFSEDGARYYLTLNKGL